MGERDMKGEEEHTLEDNTLVTFYADNTAIKLSKKYSFKKYINEPVVSSLGKVELENLATGILSYSKRLETLVGVPLDHIKNKFPSYVPFIERMVEGGFLSLKVHGLYNIIYLFPTEKLLENQKVPKRGK